MSTKNPTVTEIYGDEVSKESIFHKDFNKYKYVINNPLLLKFLYLIGIVTWFYSLYGYSQFFKLNPYYPILFGPFIFFLTLYYVVSYGINLFYEKPNVSRHKEIVQKFENTAEDLKPSVDILLPVCGEDYKILNRTWSNVRKLDYPNFKVYVLDDIGDEEVEKMAKNYGFNYLSRPNKGEMKKAGNLKYGYNNTNGDFFVIFDADFAPLPEFLNETLPYLVNNNELGLIQTPQYFEVNNTVNKRSSLEYGAGATQEDFYRIIQVSRNELGGAICVGTNAVYRRSALEKSGGTHQIEHSEDVWTGVKLLQNGYKIMYKPFILAQGFCPDDYVSFFKQQYRWCKGSMSLLFSKTFWDLKAPFSTKLCYISGFLYYIHSIFPYFMAFIVFVLLSNHFENINLYNAIPFIPYIIFSLIILPLNRLHVPKVGVYLSRFAAFSGYSVALVHTLLGINMNWHPTGIKSVRNFWFNFMFISNLIFVATYLSLVITYFRNGRMPFDNYKYYSVLFWVVYNIILFTTFILAVGYDAYFKKHRKINDVAKV
jgi:cellulose synthase (UDP-forming)